MELSFTCIFTIDRMTEAIAVGAACETGETFGVEQRQNRRQAVRGDDLFSTPKISGYLLPNSRTKWR